MIKTREDYDRIMMNAELQGKLPPEHVGLIAEIIEALREVARAADELEAAMRALPDWLLDEEGG